MKQKIGKFKKDCLKVNSLENRISKLQKKSINKTRRLKTVSLIFPPSMVKIEKIKGTTIIIAKIPKIIDLLRNFVIKAIIPNKYRAEQ